MHKRQPAHSVCAEFALGRHAGGQRFALNALPGFQGNPFNQCSIQHWVVNAADMLRDLAAVYLNDRDMLFVDSLNTAGNQLLHLLAAADDGHAVVPDIGDDIAAVAANVKISFCASFLVIRFIGLDLCYS